MRTQSWVLNLAAALIVTSTIIIVSAQESQKQPPEKLAEAAQDSQSESKKKEEDVTVCGLTTFLIRINVSVADGNDRPIPDLSHKDFAIFEDEVPQEIAFLFNDESSLSFSLAFDISDYEPLRLMARQVARSFVGQIRSTDEVTIPQLNADSQVVRDFAADKRGLENALVEIPSNDKLVSLVADAVRSTEKMRHSLRSVVVVITDGHSLSGTASDRNAAYAILRQGMPIYLIILDDGRYGSHPDVQSRLRRTRNLLTRLAKVSGGLALVVKTEDEISTATERIINRLKSQYTMGYYPTNEKFDDSFRGVRVTVTPKDKRKVKVFAPSGYYAVDPEKIREENFNDRK
jgi:Ca-activated chloride channel homolog